MRKRKLIIIIFTLALFLAALALTSSAWDGDITEQAAGELGSTAGEEGGILPWRIEGDLLLFFFLTGGAAAGFIAGYYWRKLFAEPPAPEQETAVTWEEAA